MTDELRTYDDDVRAHAPVSAKANTESLERLMAYAAHPKLWPLASDYRYQCIHGGRGSGKSFGITEALILWSDVVKDRFLLCREHMNSIADSCHAQMEAHIDNLGLRKRFIVRKNTIINRATGSEFIYRGLHTNINSVKSLVDIGFCFVEEAQAVSAASWKVLLPTIRKAGSRIIIACNPEDPDSFMQNRWITNPCPNTASVQMNYCDNPYFPKELEDERQYALRMIETAPNEDARLQALADYQWIWEGAPKRITASQVIRRVQELEFDTPDDVEFYFGLDFGFAQDPNALVRMFIYPNEHGSEDLYIDYEAVGRCELDDLPQLLDSVPGVKANYMIGTPQWPIYADCARPETISHLSNKFGYEVSAAEKWQGSVEDGIAFLNQFHRIYVHPRCKTVLQETRDYRYKVDKVSDKVLPVLIDANNHTWDATRYALWTQIKNRGKSMFM